MTASNRGVKAPDPRLTYTGGSQRGAWLRRLAGGQVLWIALILVALIVLFTIAVGDSFASVANARNIATSASILVLLALAQLFVIITGGIDLSGGAILVFSGVIAAQVMNLFGGGTGSILAGLVCGIAAGAAWGMVNGLLVTKARISPLIATLGSMGMAMGLALVITDGIDDTAPLALTQGLGVGRLFGVIPWLVIVAGIVAIAMAILLNQTKFGRYTFAIGASKAAAERAGVRVDRHLLKIYVLAGALAGIAGFLALARFGTTTISGHVEDNLKAISAVVLGGASLLGGVGTVTGAVIGALIPVVLLNGFVITGVQAFWQQFAIGLVLVIAVYLDRRRNDSRG